jgi:replicative DNA helicase
VSAVPVSPQIRVPPHDLDAETSVLGAILLDPAAITRVLDRLNADDFYRENNGQIYRAAQNLFREGEPIDNVTLASELAKLGVLERVGGRAHLALLQESVPTAANVEHYARIVKDKAYKRRLITAGSQVSALGYDDGRDADEAVNEAQATVYAISDDKVGAGMEHIYGLLKPAMDRIDAQMASGGGVMGIPSGFHDLDRMTNGFKAADLVIIAGRPSMGKCVRSDTLVVDPATGARLTIEEAVRRRIPTILGLDEVGRVRPAGIGAWVDSGVQPCYRVTTRTGRAVEVTHHHPFMTIRGWEPLHDIPVGECIAIPRRVPVFGCDGSLEVDLVRLLGYLVAEGSLSATTPGFSNTDPTIVDDFTAIVARRYPELHLRFDGRCTYFVGGRRGKPNRLTSLLREFGLWGHRAESKRFPDAAWTWSRDRLREFVRAVMSCDGTVYAMDGHPRIEFAVASEGLAADMQHALARFGIVAKLWRKTARCWRVEVTEPQSVATYQREIGWIGAKASRFPATPQQRRRSNTDHVPRAVWDQVREAAQKREMSLTQLAVAVGEWPGGQRGHNPHVRRALPSHRLAAYAAALESPQLARLASQDLYWDQVVSIEPVGEHQVYDLTVPDGANFIAADVVVHNTSFLLNVTLHAAVEHKKPVAIFSVEMSKEQLVERMLCEQARIDAQRLHRGTLSDVEYERLAGALGPLGDAPIFIDDSPVLDDLTMRLKARQARSREGIELIVLDYLQLMHGRSRDGEANRVQEVSAISRALKGIARELSIPVIAASQLSRAPEARPDKRPILSDLRESGSIEQDADIVMFLYRDDYYNREKSEKPGVAEVIVAKHRNGPTGVVELIFRKELTRFENMERRRPEMAGPDS